MKFLWLTNSDPNVAEDMLLLGLQHHGHEIEVRPWKESFSWIADPVKYGGNYLSCALSIFRRVTISRPDVIIITRSTQQQFEELYFGDVPVVHIDTEDRLNEPAAWVPMSVVRFAVQTPTDRQDIISLPYSYRSDLVKISSSESRSIRVSWGGTFQKGHGGRWELLEKSLSLGLIQATLSACPAFMWYQMARSSRSSISIGGAQNAIAGLNARHFEIAALGANVLSYRHRIRVLTEIPNICWFSTADELAERCKEEVEPLSEEVIRWNERYNSHIARAEQFVDHLKRIGIC